MRCTRCAARKIATGTPLRVVVFQTWSLAKGYRLDISKSRVHKPSHRRYPDFTQQV
jgi:hypothetical protein